MIRAALENSLFSVLLSEKRVNKIIYECFDHLRFPPLVEMVHTTRRALASRICNRISFKVYMGTCSLELSAQ